jgi:hypothetical protein
VRPARPPATKPVFMILPLFEPPLSASSESLTVSASRSSSLFLLKSLILHHPPFHRLREALEIALMSSPLVMFVRLLIPMLAARSTSSGLL